MLADGTLCLAGQLHAANASSTSIYLKASPTLPALWHQTGTDPCQPQSCTADNINTDTKTKTHDHHQHQRQD